MFDSGLPADLALVWNPRLTATAGQVVDDGSRNQLKSSREERIPVRLELSSKVSGHVDGSIPGCCWHMVSWRWGTCVFPAHMCCCGDIAVVLRKLRQRTMSGSAAALPQAHTQQWCGTVKPPGLTAYMHAHVGT